MWSQVQWCSSDGNIEGLHMGSLAVIEYGSLHGNVIHASVPVFYVSFRLLFVRFRSPHLFWMMMSSPLYLLPLVLCRKHFLTGFVWQGKQMEPRRQGMIGRQTQEKILWFHRIRTVYRSEWIEVAFFGLESGCRRQESGRDRLDMRDDSRGAKIEQTKCVGQSLEKKRKEHNDSQGSKANGSRISKSNRNSRKKKRQQQD